MKLIDIINETIHHVLNEDLNISSEIRKKTLNGDIFYHQTNCVNAENIIKNNFISRIGQGQARYTHGVYFLNHPHGSYGDCTLSAEIFGVFIDFTDDDLGDNWFEFRDSFEWDNYEDLTIKIRDKYQEIDGLLFNNLLVVWYPEKSIKNINLI
jgi:hypothetical protein